MGGWKDSLRFYDPAVKILVTVPNLHWIHKAVVQRLLLLQQDTRYRLTIELPSYKPYENYAHHMIVKLLQGDWDYWLSMDDDNPPANNPLDLVVHDLDIVGFPTPVWHYVGNGDRPIYWTGYDYVSDDDAYREHGDRDGIQRVDAIGGGCFLIARRVFDHPALQTGAFFRTWHEDGTVNKGADLAFCERARTAGFVIWAAYSHFCDQYTEVGLNEVVRAYRGLHG